MNHPNLSPAPPRGQSSVGGNGHLADPPARPARPRLIPEFIPEELRERRQFVDWRYEWRQNEKTGESKWTKVPYQVVAGRAARNAKTTDANTWGTFQEAVTLLEFPCQYPRDEFDGIGYVFAPFDPYFGVDLDRCLTADGEVFEWAIPYLEMLRGSYGEISPSGTGIKFWGRGALPDGKGTKRGGLGPDGTGAVEIYDRSRYFTVTGNRWSDVAQIADLADVPPKILAMLQARPGRKVKAKSNGQPYCYAAGKTVHSDDEVLRAAGYSAGFDSLWRGDLNGFPSPSEADMALANRLAFYCGPGQHDQVSRLFLQSGLGQRDKAHRPDYLSRTVAKAFERAPSEYFGWEPLTNGNGVRRADDQAVTEAESEGPTFRNWELEEVEPQGEPKRGPDGEELEKPKYRKVSLRSGRIWGQLDDLKSGWPKRVDDQLFVEAMGHRPLFLDSAARLFAWIDGLAPVDWKRGDQFVTQERFYEFMRMNAERFDAIEEFPHWPTMPGTFYLHPQVEPTKEKTLLKQLLKFFSFPTDEDESLCMAAIFTPFWGGPAGARPAFRIEGPEEDEPEKQGRGVGKTTLVEILASLCGGLMDLHEDEDIPAFKTRLLSEEGLSKRIARIDNIKTLRFSWAALEQFITSRVISGRRNYKGEGQRPNTVTTFITINGGSFSKDMATRVIPIRLARPKPRGGWLREVTQFVEKNRWGLIGEILGNLSDDAGSIEASGRWAEWEVGVLGKVASYDKCQKLIAKRIGLIDDDDADARDFEEFVASQLRARGHTPETTNIKIPSSFIGEWVSLYEGKHYKTSSACALLATKPVKHLKPRRTKVTRFWAWVGNPESKDYADLHPSCAIAEDDKGDGEVTDPTESPSPY